MLTLNLSLSLFAGGLCDNGVTVGNLAAEIMPTELKYVCYVVFVCVCVYKPNLSVTDEIFFLLNL